MVRLGLELPTEAYDRLLQLYGAALPEYLQINLTKDADAGEQFWQRLTASWFQEFGIAESWVKPSRLLSDSLMYGADSPYFQLFHDVLPCLNGLSQRGIKLAIISNWDYSLHRILEQLGINKRFETVIASLEEGVEKPHSRLFEICLERVGVARENVLHVGDDLLDDIEGARNAGIRSVYLDRSHRLTYEAIPHRITSLTQLPEALEWIV